MFLKESGRCDCFCFLIWRHRVQHLESEKCQDPIRSAQAQFSGAVPMLSLRLQPPEQIQAFRHYAGPGCILVTPHLALDLYFSFEVPCFKLGETD